MENKTEETFQHQGITDKEMYVHDRQLMAMLLDPRTKGNRSILSIQRWNEARVLLKLEYVHVYKATKMAERAKLKEKMKGLVSKKRGATEAELDAEILEETIPDTTNDVRTCVDTSMFNSGEKVSANSDEEGERDIGDK